MARKKSFAAGFPSEFLGITAGKIGNTPFGILNLRLNPTQNFKNLMVMIDRPGLERLVEDVTFMLANSPMLAKGKHQEVTLAEVEEMHDMESYSGPTNDQ